MSRIKLFLVAILTIVTIGLGGFVYTQQAEAQQTGGLNLNVHCQRHHGSNARAVNIDGTAYGWRCEVNGVRHTMNMDSACVEQYGSGSTSHFRDYNDQNSWYCQIAQPASQPPQQPSSQPQQPRQPPAQQLNPPQPNQVTSDRFAGSTTPLSGTYIRVDVSGLRMRTGPSTRNTILGHVVRGHYYQVHEQNGSWARISTTSGSVGWVFRDGYATTFTPERFGRGCRRNNVGTITCTAIAVRTDGGLRDPFIGIFELPTDGATARISYVIFTGNRGTTLTGRSHCGPYSGDIQPMEGFELVQGCVNAIDRQAFGEGRDNPSNWEMTYRP
jgi:hypothetical protein